MDLNGIAVFVKVVQEGSFSRAAQVLGMPKTTVSSKVSQLEESLGVTLIQRTTRKLSVTQAGEAYFKRCVAALGEISSAQAELATAGGEPFGTLKITASVDAGHALLPELVRRYLERYPKMNVELIITNRVVDLVAEGVDLALRAGELEDSSLIARKVVAVHLLLWASPDYVKKFGMPQAPEELIKHEFIFHSDITRGDALTLTPMSGVSGKELKAPLKGHIRADDFETIKMFVLQGRGMGLLTDMSCEAEEKDGRIVRVLPEWQFAAGHLAIVYPAQQFVSHNVRSFIDVAVEGCTSSM